VSLLPDNPAAAHYLSHVTGRVGHFRPAAVVVLAAVLGWFSVSGRVSPVPQLRPAAGVSYRKNHLRRCNALVMSRHHAGRMPMITGFAGDA
jgi:hypothetical protein